MAIAHFSVTLVARGSGRSAVMSAAYRHCAKMAFEREARTVDYSRKAGLGHEEFAVPDDAPAWLRLLMGERSVAGTSEAFWNRVEAFEKRVDAQLAKEMTIAVPRELNLQENIALMRDFVATHITAKGMVADWVIHDIAGNPHVHLMTTLRPLTDDGFGPKKIALTGADGMPVRNDAGRIVYALWAGGGDDFNALRDGWFDCQNRHLALAGLDLRVDGRSYESQGIDLLPTLHLGVGTKAIERKANVEGQAQSLDRLREQAALRAANARRIEAKPGIVLDLITREKSVFDTHDVASVLHRSVDDPMLFQSLMARILQHPDVLRLEPERLELVSGARAPARYTTRSLIRLEARMGAQANWLSRRSSHGVRTAVRDEILARHVQLSDEQRAAIGHVTGPERIAAVIGRAGAGKTTMMKAAKEAWQLAGHRVVGGALAGKAAEGLEREAGIPSRTLSSFEHGWAKGRDLLDEKTVFVLDEAGMVSSRQMAFFVETVVNSGAKLVLIGDPDQLQPIEAGAAFRAIADRIGYRELETIYRQKQDWMRKASLDLAHGAVSKALDAYREQDRLVGSALKADAVERLIEDWDRDYDPAIPSLILAHLRRDVRLLNRLARERLVARGVIETGAPFKTADGERAFAAGDQIVFLKNEASVGVKNGMLASVVEASPGRILAELVDGTHRQVTIEQRFYNAVDHGYATTIHKAQGATVDWVKLLASLSLDRHLTYVAMTRHRQDLRVYYGRRSFDRAGGLIAMLSRSNAKETTLDYADRPLYAQALRFAEARGLHLMRVARTVLRDQLEWTVRQGQRLAELGQRLAAVGQRLGQEIGPRLGHGLQPPADGQVSASARAIRTPAPMIAGIETFPRTIETDVEEKLAQDPGLTRRWEDVSLRFRLVFADPETAFRAVDVDAMLGDAGIAAATLKRLVEDPERFGALKGRTGLLSSREDREARKTASLNVPALARNLERYLALRAETGARYTKQEEDLRTRAAIDIPALSPKSLKMLAEVAEAMERDPLSAARDPRLGDRQLAAELEAYAAAVSARFGARAFLTSEASDVTGEAFQAVTRGLNQAQKAEIASSWDTMRMVQRIDALRLTELEAKQAERVRAAKVEGDPELTPRPRYTQ
ncbi:Ti-type conjugative transfer relaxase TraA [Rhizobium halophytocola]|uniref:Ti-type conjugative transfer relaxase TraA n=1 Tax=Rhizobium halophytocola TaxID=735519 RepID=A0ABS4E4H5_9HYPH|nr:Ti-type conjugative transfer relaxase TraA [Rhizobium halophytocola]MBP1852832.1 Ti-type conjugative transfer relaxase TraA [Rhizobium halophytocola]